MKFCHNEVNRNSRYHYNLPEVIFSNYNTANKEYHIFFFLKLIWCFYFFKILFIFFWKRGRVGEREGEKETSMCGCLSHAPYCGPGLQPRHMPGLGINQGPFGLQAGTFCTEPHQPGQEYSILNGNKWFNRKREKD